MMDGTGTADGTNGPSAAAAAEAPGDLPRSTGQGAPTDAAHADAGDGTLAGSTPAGLTVDELLQQAESGKTDDGGTG